VPQEEKFLKLGIVSSSPILSQKESSFGGNPLLLIPMGIGLISRKGEAF